MQSKVKTVLLPVFIVALLTGLTIIKANAQVSVTAKATAEVISALTAQESAILNFGRFSPQTQGGKITLSPQGVRSVEGTVVLGGGVANSAKFTITGEYEATFSITLPSGPATLTNTINAKTMQVSDWQSYPAPGIGVGKLTGGQTVVSVGAVLNIGNMLANPVGIYTGIYAITFVYN